MKDEFKKEPKELIALWEALSIPGKVLFREVMYQASKDRFVPEELVCTLVGSECHEVENFKRRIFRAKLGNETRRHWLSCATFAAWNELQERGFQWIDEESFQVNGYELQFTEFTPKLKRYLEEKTKGLGKQETLDGAKLAAETKAGLGYLVDYEPCEENIGKECSVSLRWNLPGRLC